MRPSKHEWSFHTLPAEQEQVAWVWELWREAGMDGKPWLTLSPKRQAEVMATLFPPAPETYLTPVDELRMTSEHIEFLDTAHAATPLQLHGFIIDWSRGRDKLVKAFDEWVRSRPHWKSKEDWSKTDWRNPGGRPMTPRICLTNLAILRCRRAGMESYAIETLLTPLAAWSETRSSTGNKWNVSHQGEHARKVEAEIEKARKCRSWAGYGFTGKPTPCL